MYTAYIGSKVGGSDRLADPPTFELSTLELNQLVPLKTEPDASQKEIQGEDFDFLTGFS